MTVYYNVTEPGRPDVWHNSEDCAGNYTKEISETEATESSARGCWVCVHEADGGGDSIKDAINIAHDHAVDGYEPEKTIPIGFVKIQGLDGRSKVARELKKDDRFDVRPKNGSMLGPSGTTVTITEVGGQAMSPKIDAYQRFLDVMQDVGYMDDCTVYSRAD